MDTISEIISPDIYFESFTPRTIIDIYCNGRLLDTVNSALEKHTESDHPHHPSFMSLGSLLQHIRLWRMKSGEQDPELEYKRRRKELADLVVKYLNAPTV